MKLESLLGDIDPKWHGDFVSFVQTGDASADFLNYLDHDVTAQRAVESAFTAQSQALEGLAKLVKKSGPKPAEEHNQDEASAAVARAVERITKLSGAKRDQAVADAARTLLQRAAARPDKADKLRSTLAALQHQVETLDQ